MMKIEQLENRLALSTCDTLLIGFATEAKLEFDEALVNVVSVDRPCTVEGLVIDFGDGTSSEIGGMTFSEHQRFVQRAHVFEKPGTFVVTASANGIDAVTVETTVADSMPDHETRYHVIDLNTDVRTTTVVSHGWSRDITEFTSATSPETLTSESSYGTMTIMDDGSLLYEYTGSNVAEDQLDVWIAQQRDDEGNTAAIRIEIEILAKTTPIVGDLDGNGIVDIRDRDSFFEDFQDVDGDGDVDQADIDWMRERFDIPVGDVDLDGVFNSTDLVIMFQAGHFESGKPSNWTQGDFNGDSRFDSSDLVASFIDGRYST